MLPNSFSTLLLWIQSSAELMKEITTLEAEIIHLESYILSLYRTAFEQYLPTLFENWGTHFQCKIGSQLQTKCDQSCQKRINGMQNGGCDGHAATPKSSKRVNISPIFDMLHAAALFTLLNTMKHHASDTNTMGRSYDTLIHVFWGTNSKNIYI